MQCYCHKFVGILFIVALVLTTSVGSVTAQPPFVVETIDPGGFVGLNISVAVDDDGNPHVVYWDISNFWFVYATRVDGTWVNEIIEANAFVGEEASIAIDPSGKPHVSFHNYTVTSQTLRYAVREGGSWMVENVDASANDVGRYNAIAIDAAGRPHVVYQDVTAQDLKYAVKDGAWSTEVAFATGEGFNNDLALDASGQPHISYLDDEPDLFYAHKVGSSWIREMISGAVSYAPTAIDLNGTAQPTVVYANGTGIDMVVRSGNQWVISNVSTDAAFAGAAAFDNQGRIEVIYQSTFGGLFDLWRYGFVDNGFTKTPVVETGTSNNIGAYADLARDPQGNTVVAYYDATNGDAMLADSGVWLTTSLAGSTWPVGAERTIGWRGSGAVDILLSTDGGASFETIAVGLSDNSIGGTHSFTVPHTPSRFCKIRVRRESPLAISDSDSLFTIEASVSLLNFAVTVPPSGGVDIAWSTDPGPPDLAGYRLDRRREGTWATVIALTHGNSYHDGDGRANDRYRLFAINKLGDETLVATGSAGKAPDATPLNVYPNPLTGGSLHVTFATGSGPGDSSERVTVGVYDVAGRRVAMLVDESLPAGFHETTWSGRNDGGRLVPSGVYFVRAVTAGTITTRKLAVLR